MHARFPYWRISLDYFLYFAVLGVLLPFWPLYLHSYRGFDLRTIGFLAATMAVAKTVMPNLMAWVLAHSNGNSVILLRCAGLMAALVFATMPYVDSPLVSGVVVFAFASCLTSSLPQLEAMTMALLGDSRHEYTRIRLWGSVGFTVAVLATGMLLERTAMLWLVPWLVTGAALMFFVNNLFIPSSLARRHPQDPDRDGGSQGMLALLRKPGVVALLAACCLLQLSHGPYYTYFSIYMDSHGYSARAIGHLWATGVIAEIILYTMVHRLLLRFSQRQLLLAAMLATTARWLLLGLCVDNILAVVLAQMLHAMTFGVFHAAAIQCVHDIFPKRLSARGQALYGSVSFGLGLALGQAGAALLWQQAGALVTFAAAATISAAAMALVWLKVPRSFLVS